MLRIFLIIAVLAGLAGLFGVYQTGEKLKTITGERDDANKQKEAANAASAKATKEAKDAKAAADKARTELASTQETLKATASRANEQEKRANDLDGRLAKSDQDKISAQQSLAAWLAIGLPVEQVKATKDLLRKTIEERDVMIEEKKVLSRNLTIAQAELDKFKGAEKEVKLPENLKGKIVAVDNQYDFVVLNIGKNQDVQERGKLTVTRDGKLVAKLKVQRTEANQSIANVISGTKQLEVKEGDTVFSSYEAVTAR
ncbi:MAG: hypothetical protein HY043_17865 [Verrucomicrobia bacterium]|nr:hypothetical protein [Verrucomicrobiota bacterium]